MKKLALTIALGLITGLSVLAQPVFENTYSESATICRLESLGEIYYSMDVVNKQFLVYSMDHSLLKSVPLPTPEGYYLEDVRLVSEKLFNTDELLELVYIYSKYVPTETSYYFTFEARLINEHGAILLSFPGVGFTEVIETGDHGTKFLAYEYDYSVIPYRTYTHVYSLPGKTTKSADRQVTGAGNAYPNPAAGLVHIPVSLPEGVPSGSLEIADVNGRIIMRFPVTPSTGEVVIPGRQLAPGTYIYHVGSGQGRSAPGKIVIR
jgi:hypothetical protein